MQPGCARQKTETMGGHASSCAAQVFALLGVLSGSAIPAVLTAGLLAAGAAAPAFASTLLLT